MVKPTAVLFISSDLRAPLRHDLCVVFHSAAPHLLHRLARFRRLRTAFRAPLVSAPVPTALIGVDFIHPAHWDEQ